MRITPKDCYDIGEINFVNQIDLEKCQNLNYRRPLHLTRLMWLRN